MGRPPLFLVVLLVGLALFMAMFPSRSATLASTSRFRITAYFLTDGQSAPLGVRRTVVRAGSAPLARAALQQLLAGPTARERRANLSTAIPPGTTIRSFSISRGDHGSTTTVNLLGLPPPSQVNGVELARIGTQIARTVIGLSDIARVRIEVSGQRWNFLLMNGSVSRRAWDYQLLVGLWVGNFKAVP